MFRKFPYFLLFFLMLSCGVVKKKTTYSASNERTITVKASEEKDPLPTTSVSEKKEKIKVAERSKADEIIGTALRFSGVRYKYGGTSKKGMDCSGLLYVSFQEHDVTLPRVSHNMAEEGKRIKVKNVTKGDLLFFKTGRRGKKINHVGMVVAVDGDDIKFIHATSSRGVIVSSLKEGYWNHAFIKATRVL